MDDAADVPSALEEDGALMVSALEQNSRRNEVCCCGGLATAGLRMRARDRAATTSARWIVLLLMECATCVSAAPVRCRSIARLQRQWRCGGCGEHDQSRGSVDEQS